MPPEYPTETHEKKSKKKLILVLALFTFLIAGTTTFGLLYYKTKMSSDEELAKKQKTIKELELRNTNYLKQIDELKKIDADEAEQVTEDASFREIPELGVQYALNESTSSLTYVYRGNDTVGFSNIKIADADDPANPLCFSGLGSISKLAPSDRYGASEETAETAAQRMLGNAETKNNVKKIGDNYFFYSPGNQPCYNASQNKAALEPLITLESRAIVTQALQSFQISE